MGLNLSYKIGEVALCIEISRKHPSQHVQNVLVLCHYEKKLP